MLDRKIKDWDANLELLMDRKTNSKYWFFGYFITGWTIVLFSSVFLNNIWDDIGLSIGICVLIFATWFFINWSYYDILIKIEKCLGSKKNG